MFQLRNQIIVKLFFSPSEYLIIFKIKKLEPGPGTYRLPSEFGNYDHLDMYRTTSARSSRSNSVNRSLNKTNNLSQVDFYASTSSSRK